MRNRTHSRAFRRAAGAFHPCLVLVVLGIAGAWEAAAQGIEPMNGRHGVIESIGTQDATETLDSVLLRSPGRTPIEATFAENAVIDEGVLMADDIEQHSCCDGEPADPVMFGDGLRGFCHDLCRRGCGPRWSVQVDALMLWRSNMQSVPLFVDPLAGGVALDANQVQPAMSAGPRFGVMRRIGQCAAIEGNYFNVSPFAGQASTPAAGGPFTMTNFGDLVFDDITTATLTSNARIQSAEFNWRRSVGPTFTWLAGFRWVQWNEQIAADYQFVDPNPLNLGSGSVTANTGNDLYGGQIGVDATLWDRGGPWKVSGLGKAGVYYNHAYQNSTAGFVPVLGAPYTLPTVSANADKVAFVGEVGVNSTYWLTSWLAWRAGYSLFWLSGVAVAPEQFALADYGAGTTTINTTGSVFLHGVTTGLEARW